MKNLAEQNSLLLNEVGVFASAEHQKFAYSDGEEAERQLEKALSDAKDLSSDSTELESRIHDWPSEYHLSGKRANLLRPLNLNGVERVLELGCGCGAISRYLGEQDDIQVDAVEGSMVRAKLARLRCRDQNNVKIHCANFNNLEIPQGQYDLVLLVGVTEYAGRFSSRETDQQALQDLLSLAQAAIKPGGAVIIAIENRLGLKYLQGACEDHYGEPWVGIDNYPHSSGIRTYSLPEWQQQIDDAGFKAQQFCFPFPDYKVPTAIVAGQVINSPKALTAIQKTTSRDYLTAFSIPNEHRLWQGLAEANSVDQFANSFLILLSNNSETLVSISGFEVCEFEAEPYNWHPDSTDANTLRLQNKLAEVTELCEQRLAEVELLKSSKGMRLARLLRKFFRQDRRG